MISSLLDTDFYKFTMGQVARERFSGTLVKYRFKNRGGNNLSHLCDSLKEKIKEFKNLKLTNGELKYLKSTGFFRDSYLSYLKTMDLSRVRVHVFSSGEELNVEVSGLWEEAIFFEAPVLAMINELHFQASDQEKCWIVGKQNLNKKMHFLKESLAATEGGQFPFLFCDFGTRRRFSREWQKEVVETLQSEFENRGTFFGTSNVLLAKELDLKPIGTMAHEYLQAMQKICVDEGGELKNFQKMALDEWKEFYRDSPELLIALSDVVGSKAFIQDFSKDLAEAYRGTRWDSGSAEDYTNSIISRYKELGIDPLTKLILYSDGLDLEKALDLWRKFHGKIKTAAAIGTNLSNDCGEKPLNIVMKIVECSGAPVAKLSDSPGKEVGGSVEFIEQLKKLFR